MERCMKNLLKLFLLLVSAFAVSGLNASKHLINGKIVIVPDVIKVVNNTAKDATVYGLRVVPGERLHIDDVFLKDLKGSVQVEQDGKVARLTFATPQQGKVTEKSFDRVAYNLSDVLNNLKDENGFSKSQ